MTQDFSLGKLPEYFTIFALLPPIQTGCSRPGVAVSNRLLMGKKMPPFRKRRQFPTSGCFQPSARAVPAPDELLQGQRAPSQPLNPKYSSLCFPASFRIPEIFPCENRALQKT